MPRINIINNPFNNFTPVSNFFITHYMLEADGTYVKIYLYTLNSCMNNNKPLNTSVIAKTLNILESDVINSFKYWEKVNVMKVNFTNNTIIDIQFLELNEINIENTPVFNPPQNKSNITKAISLEHKPEYSPEELALYSNSPEIRQLFLIAERYLGKTLSPIELNTLYGFYDWLRLPTEVIEYLLEYCISNGHSNMRYIEKVALSWSDADIDTIDKANQLINNYNKDYREIMKAFGISRREPAASEIKYMKKWINEYKFTVDIIVEACNRTIQNISAPSFQYADSILINWSKAKVKILEDIKSLDQSFSKKRSSSKPPTTNNQTSNVGSEKKSKFANFKEREDIDFDKIERLSRLNIENELYKGR